MRLNSCITNSSGCFGETVSGVCEARRRSALSSPSSHPSPSAQAAPTTHLIDECREINRSLLRIVEFVHWCS